MEAKIIPEPPRLLKLLGPSFLILAMGLGSGEVILWPFMVANYGLGIAWVAIVGLTLQFFINMEIERYALVTGESVFYGFYKLWRWLPIWFIISSFIGFGLPGIIASSALVIKSLFGLDVGVGLIGSVLLIIIGLILSIGKTVYSLMENLTKYVIGLGVLVVLIVVLYFSGQSDYGQLFAGLIGIGEGYNWLPAGIVLTTLFSAFAYSGAGGNLNLTQSIYIREKGYGMGYFSHKMSGLFRKKSEQTKIDLSGNIIGNGVKDRAVFKKWWRLINWEHGIIFWFIGGVMILMLMLLSYVTVYNHELAGQGINFVIAQGAVISQSSWPFAGQIFLLLVAIMLAQTQLSVIDSISRIVAENIAILKRNKTINLSNLYYITVWSLVIFGVLLFAFGKTEPKFLLVLAGMINGVCMAIHVLLTFIINHKFIPEYTRPVWWRKIVILLAFSVFFVFASFSVMHALK